MRQRDSGNLGQRSNALVLLMGLGTLVVCKNVLLIHVWSNWTFFLLLFSRSLEKLYKAVYRVLLQNSVVFGKSRLIFLKNTSFRFLDFCTSEVIHCISLVSPPTISPDCVQSSAHWFLVHWLPTIANSIILAKPTKQLPSLYIMSNCCHSLCSFDAICVFLPVLFLYGLWNPKEVFSVLCTVQHLHTRSNLLLHWVGYYLSKVHVR